MYGFYCRDKLLWEGKTFDCTFCCQKTQTKVQRKATFLPWRREFRRFSKGHSNRLNVNIWISHRAAGECHFLSTPTALESIVKILRNFIYTAYLGNVLNVCPDHLPTEPILPSLSRNYLGSAWEFSNKDMGMLSWAILKIFHPYMGSGVYHIKTNINVLFLYDKEYCV